MDYTFNGSGGNGSTSDAGDDELLAMLEFNVNSSDMAMVNVAGLSQLASDSVHYNPSDLPSLRNNVIDNSAMNTADNNTATAAMVESTSAHVEDLQAVPGDAIQPPASTSNNQNPIVIVYQENGFRLVLTLKACAEAVHQENVELAETLIKQAGILAARQIGPMNKVAAYFCEGLSRRIYRLHPQTPQDSPAFNDVLQMHFYNSGPYLKFAHFTANQAILEAFAGKKSVHVIDFSLKQGNQWPALMQALALRPGGPPSFRLTGIGMAPGDNTDPLEETGLKLSQLADTINLKFEYKGYIVNNLTDVEPAILAVREDEVVAVNSVFELHRLLVRPGAVGKLLLTVKAMNPAVFTVVEQEANHNGVDFLDRFNDCLEYYSAMFESLESGGGGLDDGGGTAAMSSKDKVMSQVYLGKQICNVVACEGGERIERHELLSQWKVRFDLAGFERVHLGSYSFWVGGEGYKVEENDGCLMLSWKNRPMITSSAWKLRVNLDESTRLLEGGEMASTRSPLKRWWY